MSTNQTASYGLHLWEPGDNFLREEFNENFVKLDEAAAEKIGAVVGSFPGGMVDVYVKLGFRPKAVYMASQLRVSDGAGFCIDGQPQEYYLRIKDDGFISVFGDYEDYGNFPGKTVIYIAFR